MYPAAGSCLRRMACLYFLVSEYHQEISMKDQNQAASTLSTPAPYADSNDIINFIKGFRVMFLFGADGLTRLFGIQRPPGDFHDGPEPGRHHAQHAGPLRRQH